MVVYSVNGGSCFNGRVKVSGAKNFSIKALAASLLVRGESHFSNLPNNLDVHKTLSMLKDLGVEFFFDADSKTCKVNTINLCSVLNDSNNTNMTTFLLASALLKYFDFIVFPKMRGCDLGDRLTDFHELAFKKFGVNFFEKDGGYCLQKNSLLRGVNFNLPYPSVGATETCLFLASISSGVSVIGNVAIEPEINALISLLIEMGIDIFYEADRSLKIVGNKKLSPISNGFIHGDYLEAATWAVLAAISDGEIVVEGIIPELIGSFLGAFSMLGGKSRRLSNDSMVFSGGKGNNVSKSICLETGVFPMLRTDLQPLLAVMAVLADGSTTLIHETVYNNRLEYIEDFNAFGADLIGFNECFGSRCKYSAKYLHSVVIKGVSYLKGVPVLKAKTVRSGMANLLLASLASGRTNIECMEVVERGYCSLFEKLIALGVNVERFEK